MNAHTALLAGPAALHRYVAEAASEQRVVDLARVSLDVVVAHHLWKRPLPRWLRTVLLEISRSLGREVPSAALVERLADESASARSRTRHRFRRPDTWLALRLSAMGEAVFDVDRNVADDARALCVALHEARLVEAQRLLFRVRLASRLDARRRHPAVALASEQATHYLRHLIPLAAQPSASWEWRLLCAALADRRPT